MASRLLEAIGGPCDGLHYKVNEFAPGIVVQTKVQQTLGEAQPVPETARGLHDQICASLNRRIWVRYLVRERWNREKDAVEQYLKFDREYNDDDIPDGAPIRWEGEL